MRYAMRIIFMETMDDDNVDNDGQYIYISFIFIIANKTKRDDEKWKTTHTLFRHI